MITSRSNSPSTHIGKIKNVLKLLKQICHHKMSARTVQVKGPKPFLKRLTKFVINGRILSEVQLKTANIFKLLAYNRSWWLQLTFNNETILRLRLLLTYEDLGRPKPTTSCQSVIHLSSRPVAIGAPFHPMHNRRHEDHVSAALSSVSQAILSKFKHSPIAISAMNTTTNMICQ